MGGGLSGRRVVTDERLRRAPPIAANRSDPGKGQDVPPKRGGCWRWLALLILSIVALLFGGATYDLLKSLWTEVDPELSRVLTARHHARLRQAGITQITTEVFCPHLFCDNNAAVRRTDASGRSTLIRFFYLGGGPVPRSTINITESEIIVYHRPRMIREWHVGGTVEQPQSLEDAVRDLEALIERAERVGSPAAAPSPPFDPSPAPSR